MYSNAGKSIKNLVKVIVGVQMALYIVVGIVLMFSGRDGSGVFLGLLVAGGGCFLAWISGLILYAYGEIADGIQRLANTTGTENVCSLTQETNHNPEHKWTCAGCGTENPIVRKYCLKCNVSKEWSESRS